jgi:hypothetical protein
LLLKAVRHHPDCRWVLLFIERWLKASVRWRTAASFTVGTPQGGVGASMTLALRRGVADHGKQVVEIDAVNDGRFGVFV